MNKSYLELFTLLCQTVENLAEQVMSSSNKEDNQYTTSEIMRNDYAKLKDKLENEKGENLTKADYAKLLVGSIILTNQINSKIEYYKKALQGYKIDIIPKLDQINNAKPEEIPELAKKLFEIKEEEKKSDN